MNEMEELENQVNDVLGRLRRMAEAGRVRATAGDLAKLGELADRLHVQIQQFRKDMTEADYLPDDNGDDEPKPAGQARRRGSARRQEGDRRPGATPRRGHAPHVGGRYGIPLAQGG